jgi:hypothetical protein
MSERGAPWRSLPLFTLFAGTVLEALNGFSPPVSSLPFTDVSSD